ncbi:hypothetical protein BDV96DRAFT_612396 [Lophiotrema nucula]|uniref:Ring-like domain-containing protein n=1 Tax=Lophiotrema nucula TaxID=690887 RepID=A0A6A5ZBI7_9PLEO|nr:hypothetical protein BDV96DRAFT_612396 [Lophiotrema nucula]
MSALSYFNVKKLRRSSKQHDTAVVSPSEEPASPVLDEEDQRFLERLAAIASEPEGTPPPLPSRPASTAPPHGEEREIETNRTVENAAIDEAIKTSLPTSPPAITVDDTTNGEAKGKEKASMPDGRKKSVMSYFALAQSKFKKSGDKEKKKDKVTSKEKEKAATDLHSAAESTRKSENEEAEQEKQDMTEILDQLNLSAVNNRVFSFSKESTELLDKFKLVLKDVVNGAPTAYGDLEKLFTDYDNQIKKLYGNLPPFLQNLVKSLPTKISAALAPELLAASAEKPGFDAKQMGSKGAKKSMKARIPSLKSLVTAEGAVATMLKSIFNFLKLRFPMAVTGTNVLLSLAVFILMFVFWYCHKRGRETRLEREKSSAEGADSVLASDASTFEEDGGSLVEDKPESSRARDRPEPPLIISDNKEQENTAQSNATVNDMPSVSHLPEPTNIPLPQSNAATPMKEEPLKVLGSK